MKVIVGLGNPGPQYDRTRHNAGFMVVDRLVARHAPSAPARSRFQSATWETTVRGERVLLAKPLTYMNRSGPAVSEAVRFYKADPATDLLVVVDEVYLPCGTIRLKPGGGTAGHNGLADIDRCLGTGSYPRLRVGVGPKPSEFDQADYVLGRFTEEQWSLASPALDRAAGAAEAFATAGLSAAMNTYNAPDPPRAGDGAAEPKDSR